jgi:hypothetical protein
VIPRLPRHQTTTVPKWCSHVPKPTARLIVSVVPVLDAVTSQVARGRGESSEPSQLLEDARCGDNSEH